MSFLHRTKENHGIIDLKFNNKIIGKLDVYKSGADKGEIAVKLTWDFENYKGYSISQTSLAKILESKIATWDLTAINLKKLNKSLMGV